MTWQEFVSTTPSGSIALDGVVRGGPAWSEESLHANFDHHEEVVREATMSTAMQVLFALKGGLMDRLPECRVYVNDVDQDTVFAYWLLFNHKKFSGVQSHPVINRLLALNDRWDITAGAFPMSLDDTLVRQHCWVFEPYTELRKSGRLSEADEREMRLCLDLCMARLTAAWLGSAQEKDLDVRYEILHADSRYKIINEIGGNEARYFLFSQDMLNGYVSLVATRKVDGRFVYTIGRKSRYVDFPVPVLLEALSKAEPTTAPWGGSDIVGGSNREKGSGLHWEQVRQVIDAVLNRGSRT